jgi:hypothetical protein
LGLICSETSSSEKIFFILQQQITKQSKNPGQTNPCLFLVCECVHLVNRTPGKTRPPTPWSLAQNLDFLRGPRLFWPLKWHER